MAFVNVCKRKTQADDAGGTLTTECGSKPTSMLNEWLWKNTAFRLKHSICISRVLSHQNNFIPWSEQKLHIHTFITVTLYTNLYSSKTFPTYPIFAYLYNIFNRKFKAIFGNAATLSRFQKSKLPIKLLIDMHNKSAKDQTLQTSAFCITYEQFDFLSIPQFNCSNFQIPFRTLKISMKRTKIGKNEKTRKFKIFSGNFFDQLLDWLPGSIRISHVKYFINVQKSGLKGTSMHANCPPLSKALQATLKP